MFYYVVKMMIIAKHSFYKGCLLICLSFQQVPTPIKHHYCYENLLRHHGKKRCVRIADEGVLKNSDLLKMLLNTIVLMWITSLRSIRIFETIYLLMCFAPELPALCVS